MTTPTLKQIVKTHGQWTETLNSADNDYQYLLQVSLELCQQVHEYDGDNSELWYVSNDEYPVIDIIPALYWHLSEWHAGQNSLSYAVLCAASEVFQPGMSTEPENGTMEHIIYELLNDMAERHTGK